MGATTRRRRRFRAAFLATFVATLGFGVHSAPASATEGSAARPAARATRARALVGDEAQQFVDRINALRADRGLDALAVDSELSEQARIWSDTMRRQHRIFHSQSLSQGISANWQKLGENVGVGPTVDQLFDAFVASPKHYENLVDPAYRFVGIGVAWDGDTMYTAHRFMAVFPSLPPAEPAPEAPVPDTVAVPAPSDPVAPTVPSTTEAPTIVPVELPAADAAPTADVPAPTAGRPVAPPSDPERVDLVLSSLSSVPG